MLPGNTIELAHMALCLVPKILDAVDVVMLISKEFRMVDAIVLEFRDVQYVVASPAIRIDDAVRYHLALNDGV